MIRYVLLGRQQRLTLQSDGFFALTVDICWKLLSDLQLNIIFPNFEAVTILQ